MQTTQEGPLTTYRVASDAPTAGARADISSQPRTVTTPHSLEGRLLQALLNAFGNPPVQFALWNGERISATDSEPVATLHISDKSALWRLCTDPDIEFGELYSAKQLQVEGDLGLLIEALYRSSA